MPDVISADEKLLPLAPAFGGCLPRHGPRLPCTFAKIRMTCTSKETFGVWHLNHSYLKNSVLRQLLCFVSLRRNTFRKPISFQSSPKTFQKLFCTMKPIPTKQLENATEQKRPLAVYRLENVEAKNLTLNVIMMCVLKIESFFGSSLTILARCSASREGLTCHRKVIEAH